MPKWGETLRGSDFTVAFGGKGANQAVMAAKLGANVSMVGKVGADIFGDGIMGNMKKYGIDVSHLQQTDGARTGAAQIMVDENGRNAIIVVTGASDLMSAADVRAAGTLIKEADTLLVQWEMPLEASIAAMEIAKEAGTKTIFNPAPMGNDLPHSVFSLCDIICLNETEIAKLAGMSVERDAEISAVAGELIEKGARSVVVTRGEKGVFYKSPETYFHIEPHKVDAKDSTGAGDCFCGSLGYFLAMKKQLSAADIKEALQKANRLAAISVQGKGTQSSYPDREELSAIL
jgi:ribokinase